jgi:serralysin
MRLHVLTPLLIALTAISSSAADHRLPKDEERVVQLTNDFRKQNDKPPLTVNPLLAKAAQQHALNMAKQDKMAHELDEKNYEDRVKATGYDYRALGENIANYSGEGDLVNAAFKLWTESEVHRDNMLASKLPFTEIGVGVVVTDSGKKFFCQVFATPAKESAKAKSMAGK